MRWMIYFVAALSFCFFSTEAVYSASFGDMFGGKKKKEEQKQLLQQKDLECKALIKQKDLEVKKLQDQTKDFEDTAQSLREKNSTLVQAYEKIVNDQGDIAEQLSRLRLEKQRCDQVTGEFDQMTEENEAFLQENQSLEQDKKILKITLDNLKSHIAELTEENDKLSVYLREAQEDENIKIKRMRDKVANEVANLKRQNSSLIEENDTLSNLLKEFEKKSKILTVQNMEIQQQSDVLQNELTDLEKDHAVLKDENRYLEKEASTFPKKFTDLARHNRKLVKETSHMHYNMGVSFIKAKEYKRAVKEFKKVLELDPNDAHANYNLGYIYAEHLVDRPAAIKHFKHYLTYAKDEKDIDWVKKYILTWQTWYGKEKMK